jgi:DNA (cytosine-5)-methyltransferase 1
LTKFIRKPKEMTLKSEVLTNPNELEEPIIGKTKMNSTRRASIKTKELKVLSLFSGCGGMDLGFEGGFMVLKESVNEKLSAHHIEKNLDNGFVQLKKTRFRTVFANDILEPGKDAWQNYFIKRGHKSSIFHGDSIVDLVKKHHNGQMVFPQNIDVVTGGFPCQDFSIAGKRNGFSSHRNHKGQLVSDESPSIETRGQLYMWMKEVIEITQPKIFIAENVKGLVNLDNVKDIIQGDFSSASGNGYLVLSPQVLHSADYGVPQSRERVIFIGIKKSELSPEVLEMLSEEVIPDYLSPYPPPTHNFTQKNSTLKEFVKLQSVFDKLEEPEHSNDPSQQNYSQAKFMGKHCQGQIEVRLNGISPTIRAEHHGNIEFRRLSREHGGKNQTELDRGLKERRLTVRECAMIQTFPPDYEFVIPQNGNRKKSFVVSPSQAYKIIGNAVPPLLAFHIAKRLEDIWPLYFPQS